MIHFSLRVSTFLSNHHFLAFNGEGKFETCPTARWLAVFLDARNEGPRLFKTHESEACSNFKHARTRFVVFADALQDSKTADWEVHSACECPKWWPWVLRMRKNKVRRYCECAQTWPAVILNARKRLNDFKMSMKGSQNPVIVYIFRLFLPKRRYCLFPLLQEASLYEGLDRSFPEDYNPDSFSTDHSGKLQVLSHILANMHCTGERVVLVSNYTQVRCPL